MADRKKTALRALACLDLTNLDDGCTQADVTALCERADTPYGEVAAVCVWPRFVAHAQGLVGGSGIKVATVVNFPKGGEDVKRSVGEARQAVDDGANEVDLVVPYRTLADSAGPTHDMVKAVAGALPESVHLKAILETGELESEAVIRRASEAAIEGGAHFIKTSTGKVATNATPEAARIMLEVIRDKGGTVGLKPAGGIRTYDDAANYLHLADEILGQGWAKPACFRLGASSLLDALMAELD